MVTAFQRQQSSARLFYLRVHLCPHLGHRQAMAPEATAALDNSRRRCRASSLKAPNRPRTLTRRATELLTASTPNHDCTARKLQVNPPRAVSSFRFNVMNRWGNDDQSALELL
jgi:hypothetical protein